MSERLVIVGGDAAGMTAATNARRLRAAADLEIVAFERSAWASFSACGEPYFVGGQVQPFEALLVRSPEQFARQGIAVHLRHEVTAIDTRERTVTVRDLEAGRTITVGYDALMYATGAEAQHVPIAGRDLAGVHEMHVLDDALAVRALVTATPPPRRAAIVGGGYVALELAEAFQRNGIATTIVTSGAGLLAGSLDAELSTLLVERVRALGVAVATGHRVQRLQGQGGRVIAVGEGEGAVPADLVILATGAEARVALARAAGLRLGATGAVWVDDHQRTSAPGVYAGGDCAEALHRVSGRPVNLYLGTVANKQGRVAGLNIGGADEAFPGVLGTAITRLGELEVSRTGLTEAQAREAGFDALGVTFEGNTAAGYWPASTTMTVKVVVDRVTRRLLGAQIIGGPTAAKRIDALAMALWNAMTVDAMVNVDLSYAPPFSGVWEPVLMAARIAQSALDAAGAGAL